jgi:V/A-type H+-transporting ATPase subunit K
MLTVVSILSGVFIVSVIGVGVYFKAKGKRVSPKTAKTLLAGSVAGFIVMMIVASLLMIFVPSSKAYSAPSEAVEVIETPAMDPYAEAMAYLSAAIAVGIGSLGAAIAVGMSASAAVGAISENPQVFGKAMIFVGLAEGIAIYGLIIAIMILSRLGGIA